MGKDRYVGKMEHADKVTAVVWIRTEEKGEQIVSASGKLVVLWDPSKLQEMARLIGHTAMVTSLAVHPAFLRPNLVFAGSKDRKIRVFDLRSATKATQRGCQSTIKASKMIWATSRSIPRASWL
jgi:WD40 repeat protein